MALDLTNTIDVIEVMENYIERVRPPHHMRKELDVSYKIDNQSIILMEIRPSFPKPKEIIEFEYAKATYVKSQGVWKVYWRRGNGNWVLYEPCPYVGNLKEFTELIEEDKHHCFKG